jgi:hypothetical protein
MILIADKNTIAVLPGCMKKDFYYLDRVLFNEADVYLLKVVVQASRANVVRSACQTNRSIYYEAVSELAVFAPIFYILQLVVVM